MSNQIYVDLFKQFGRVKGGEVSGIVIGMDVDLNLVGSTLTNTTQHQQFVFSEFYNRTGGRVYPISGRKSESIELTLPGGYEGSYEHHAAMRFERHGDIIALAETSDTQLIADFAAKLISKDIEIVGSSADVSNSHMKKAVIFPEVKNFGVALIRSLGHDAAHHSEQVCVAAAHATIKELGLEESHKVTCGRDAVEIVPKGLGRNSEARLILADKPSLIARLDQNLCKDNAVHTFMGLNKNSDCSFIMSGDGEPDMHAALVARREYGGGGVFTSNGNTLEKMAKEDSALAHEFQLTVGPRIVPHYSEHFAHIEASVNWLRDHASIVKLVPDGIKDIIDTVVSSPEPAFAK